MASLREDAFSVRTGPDQRKSASLTLLAVVICATPLLALTPRVPVGPATPAVSGNRLAEASPPRVVKIVDSPAPSLSCAERTWPYYDSRCTPRASESGSAAVPAPQSAAAAAATINPATVAAPPAAVPPAETVGAAARADDAAPSSPPLARTWSNAPDSDRMQRDDRRWAAGEDTDPRAFEPVKPQHRTVRRHHFGFFGIRF